MHKYSNLEDDSCVSLYAEGGEQNGSSPSADIGLPQVAYAVA